MTAGAGAHARQRLFVALAPGEDQRRQLARAVRTLDHRGRPVPAANLHLTLAFLGPAPASLAAAVRAALADVRAEPFELGLRAVGHFPRPRVLWCAGTPAPAALYRLQGQVAHALSLAGVTPEARRFTPHVTVARKVTAYRGPGELAHPVTWTLREFRLVASRTLPGGARYDTLQAYGLRV